MHGYRLAWSSAVVCPCKIPNDQIQQADPTCTLCKGSGWFLQQPAPTPLDIDRFFGPLDDLQKKILADHASPIMGLMSNFVTNENAWDQVRRRLEGTTSVTVRAENKLGYYDRITNLDSVIVYSQTVEMPAEGERLSLAYPAVRVNVLRTVSTVYHQDGEFVLNEGDLVWDPAEMPAPGTRLCAHYYCHPVWRVLDHPHSTRASLVKLKSSLPKGKFVDLPVQANVRYEFLL